MATQYVDAGTAIDNSSLSGIVGSAPPVAKNLTYDRILNARSEPQNWLTYYGAYDGQRYSPLDQINTSNVNQLTPAWVYQIGSMGMHSGASTYAWEASPIVVDGTMFVSAWDGQLFALDAATGEKLWDQPYGDVRAGESATVAPLIVKDMVIVGSSGGEFGVRGHTDAFKLENGERVWRCYMVPKPGEAGAETWPADGEGRGRGG